jgi:hypothetical protein
MIALNEKFRNFLKSNIFTLLIQLLILVLTIYLIGYTFTIDFDSSTTFEHRVIIQGLGNLLLYEFSQNMFFFYILWLVVGLVPVIIQQNVKRVYSINLKLFLVLNFFFYVFLWKYSPEYFNAFFPFLLVRSIILGGFLEGFSILISFSLNKVKNYMRDEEKMTPKLALIAEENKFKCPYCSTTFDSIPKICYKCSKIIQKEHQVPQSAQEKLDEF